MNRCAISKMIREMGQALASAPIREEWTKEVCLNGNDMDIILAEPNEDGATVYFYVDIPEKKVFDGGTLEFLEISASTRGEAERRREICYKNTLVIANYMLRGSTFRQAKKYVEKHNDTECNSAAWCHCITGSSDGGQPWWDL